MGDYVEIMHLFVRHMWSFFSKTEWLLALLSVTVACGISIYAFSLDGKALNFSEREFSYPILNASDSTAYSRLAVNLLEHGTYSEATAPPYTKAHNWPPGYASLIAITLALFGSAWPLAFIQILLFAYTTVLIFRMAKRFVPPHIAILPAIVYALDFSIAFYSGVILTDSLFTSLLCILIYQLFFRQKPHSLGTYFALGVLLGCTAYLRTISQYLIVVLPILYLSYGYVTKMDVRRVGIGMGIFIITASAIITPWLIRNHQTIGSYTLGTIGSKMLLHYYVTDFLIIQNLKTIDGKDFSQSETAASVRDTIAAELETRVSQDGGSPETYFSSLAKKHILENPVAYTRFHLIGTLPYFLAGSYRHFFVSTLGPLQKNAGLPYLQHQNFAHQITEAIYSGKPSVIVAAVSNLSFVLVEVLWRITLLMGAALAWFVTHKQHRWLILILGILIFYFALLTGPASLTRYRIVSEPLLLTISTVGWWGMYSWFKGKRDKRVYAKED